MDAWKQVWPLPLGSWSWKVSSSYKYDLKADGLYRLTILTSVGLETHWRVFSRKSTDVGMLNPTVFLLISETGNVFFRVLRHFDMVCRCLKTYGVWGLGKTSRNLAFPFGNLPTFVVFGDFHGIHLIIVWEVVPSRFSVFLDLLEFFILLRIIIL